MTREECNSSCSIKKSEGVKDASQDILTLGISFVQTCINEIKPNELEQDYDIGWYEQACILIDLNKHVYITEIDNINKLYGNTFIINNGVVTDCNWCERIIDEVEGSK